MGEYLPDEAMEDISETYLKEIENLAEDEICCYMIAELKVTHERIGTCSFILDKDSRAYDIAYCVHKNIGEKDMQQKWLKEWLIMQRHREQTR